MILPPGPFAAILADPPWQFRTWSERGKGRSADRYYKTMSVSDLAMLPVASLACEQAVLFLWVTWPLLDDGLWLMKAWGFRYRTCAFNWIKLNRDRTLFTGLGYWTRANSEVCLLGTRGYPKRLGRDVAQVVASVRERHSQKPEEVHRRIERLVAGPYLELFCRGLPRPGWTAWGDQVAVNREQENGRHREEEQRQRYRDERAQRL